MIKNKEHKRRVCKSVKKKKLGKVKKVSFKGLN